MTRKLKSSRRGSLSFGSPLLLAAVVSITGCGGPHPIPISPKFLVDGSPLSEASITFVRQDGEGGRASFGMTDSEGKATLTTFEPHDGVLPGEYRVVVIKAPETPHTYVDSGADANDPEAMMKRSSMAHLRGTPRKKRVRTLLPDEYSDPGTTPLTCTVDRNGEDLVFEIESAASSGQPGSGR